MVKKTPAWQYVSSATFESKGAAEKFAVSQRKRKAELGQKTRYEIDMDPQTGKFRVREFIYLADEKGRLL